MRWSDVAVEKDETTYALVQKDTNVERGKRLCASGSIIEIEADRVTTSCGYAVPLMDLVDERDRLIEWAEKKGDDGIAAYWGTKNRESMDGLPGIGS